MAQLDDAQLLAFFEQYLPNNDSELITPSVLRLVLAQLVESKASLAALVQFAQLDSPRFTGVPQVPTAPAGTNSDQVASTAFVQATLVAIANGKTLRELVLPLDVQPGPWYLNSTGFWEARRPFRAEADPVNGPNWRLVAGFAGQLTTLPVAGLSDATDAGRAMLTASSATVQRGLVNNPQIRANQYGNHPAFNTEDGPLGAWAWVIKAILALSSGTAAQQPQAPTAGLVDDTGDTFSFLPNPVYASFAQYLVNGLPGVTGAVALDSTNSYVLGNRIFIKVVGAVAKGGLAVYVAGSGKVPDGQVLTNADPFTGSAVVTPPPATTTPDAPFPSYDPATRVLTFQHALGTSELEYNRFGGSFSAYAPIQVDDSSHSAGEWKARVKAYAAGNRNASGTADSPAIAAKTVAVNQIPVVSAGQQISIQLPTNSVALMGSGSDPDPGDSIASWAWRLVTGPNTPTGLPANTQNFVASNLIEGTYQIGLRGTDTRGAQSNEAFTVISVTALAAVATSAPSVTYTSATRKLSAQHDLGGSLLVSYKGSAFAPYTGIISVDSSAHDAGEWQFKRAASSGYLESPAAGSPAIAQVVTTTSTEVDLVIEGHSMAQYPNDYTEWQQPFVDKANTTFAVNGFPNRITNVRNFAHSGDRLLGGATGMVAQYASQVKGTSVANKINVLALYWLTNELSNQAALDQTPGVASQATYALARDYVRQCKLDDPGRLIITELLTPRSNPETVQPAFNNECQKLNSLIKAGMASGDYPIDAIAPIGEDVRKLQPGPPGGTYYFDTVHPSQQSNDIIESRYFADALVHAVQPSYPAPVAFTGSSTANLYLPNAQKPLIAQQTGGVRQPTNGSGIYTVATGGGYGDWSHDVLLGLKMPAGGASKIGSKTPGADALNVIWGLTGTNALCTGPDVYKQYKASFYRHEDGRLRYSEDQSQEYQIGPKMGLNEWPLFAKDAAGVLKVVSTADGITYSDLVTFAGNYAADHYVHMAVEASLGKVFAPQGFGLVAIPVTGALVSTRADSAAFVVTTGWNQLPENGGDAFSKTLGSYGTFEFTGSSLRVFGQYGTGYGVMKITVDDGTPVLVDLTASTPGPNQLLHDFGSLDYSAHKVVIELVNNDGKYIVVNSFETRQ